MKVGVFGVLLLAAGCGQSVCVDHPADYPGCVSFDVMPKSLSRLSANQINLVVGDPGLTELLGASGQPPIMLSQNSDAGPIDVPLDGIMASERQGDFDVFQLLVDGVRLKGFEDGSATLTVGSGDRVAQSEVSVTKFAFPVRRPVYATGRADLHLQQWSALVNTPMGAQVALMTVDPISVPRANTLYELAFDPGIRSSPIAIARQQQEVTSVGGSGRGYCAMTALDNFVAAYCANSASLQTGMLNIFAASGQTAAVQSKDHLASWGGTGVIFAGDPQGSRLLLLQDDGALAYDVWPGVLSVVTIDGYVDLPRLSVAAAAVGDLDGDHQADAVLLRGNDVVPPMQVFMGRDKTRLVADPDATDYLSNAWKVLAARWQVKPSDVGSMVIAGIDGNGRNRLLLAGKPTRQSLPVCMLRLPAARVGRLPVETDIRCLDLPLPESAPALGQVTLSAGDIDLDGNLDLLVFITPQPSGSSGSLFVYLNQQ